VRKLTSDEERTRNMFKKMLKELFGATDVELKDFQMFKVEGDALAKILPRVSEQNYEDIPEPLVEIHENDEYFSILIDSSGIEEDSLFLNIKKEGDKTNLIFGVNTNGRMALRRMELPDKATENFERETRGTVVELKVRKAK